MADSKRFLISIITPCFNEEESILRCVETVRTIFHNKLPDYNYEHIFSDNNSDDKTVEILKSLALNDKKIKIIVNSRNFGPFRSMFNGLKRSSGDAVVTFLPVDLQDPPALIPQFVELWRNGYDIVAGVRKTRAEFFIFRILRSLFYKILNNLSDFEIPEKVGEFQLIDRRVANAVLSYQDKYPFVRAIIAATGYRRTMVSYHWKKREHGKSRLSLFNLLDQAMTGIFSFSTIPLRISTLLGLMISLICLLYSFYTTMVALLGWSNPQEGIFTLITGLFFLFGIQLVFFGIMGEYLIQIHRQVRGGEIVFEREVINFDTSSK